MQLTVELRRPLRDRDRCAMAPLCRNDLPDRHEGDANSAHHLLDQREVGSTHLFEAETTLGTNCSLLAVEGLVKGGAELVVESGCVALGHPATVPRVGEEVDDPSSVGCNHRIPRQQRFDEGERHPALAV